MDPELKAALDKAFLAEGWEVRKLGWAKEPRCTETFGHFHYIYSGYHMWNFLCGATLEDLPCLLLQEERGLEVFGHTNWEAVLPVLQRVLQME